MIELVCDGSPDERKCVYEGAKIREPSIIWH